MIPIVYSLEEAKHYYETSTGQIRCCRGDGKEDVVDNLIEAEVFYNSL
jgi:hypothetical protein